MADLAAHLVLETKPGPTVPGQLSAPIADAVTLYAGALVGLEGGYANHWADGANDVFAGIVVNGDIDASTTNVYLGDITPAAGLVTPEVSIATGVTLMHLDSVGDTPTQAKVGDLVYCNTSNVADMTLNASGMTHPIGWLSRFRSATDVDVTLFTPSEMLAQATA